MNYKIATKYNKNNGMRIVRVIKRRFWAGKRPFFVFAASGLAKL